MSRSPYQSGLVDIAGIVIERREKAVWLNAGTSKAWLPLSQIEMDPPGADAGHSVSVAMPEWLAKEKGLI
jgi:hypothetical protein